MQKDAELTQKQKDAVHLLFDGQKDDQDIAAELGVDPRTLRRWKAIPEFNAAVETLKAELFERSRKHVLATKEGRVASKIERHRLLTAELTLRQGDLTTSVRDTIALCRELSRLEAEISKELGQDNAAPVIEQADDTIQDLSCLTQDELDIMELVLNKLAATNPWLASPNNHPPTKDDLAHGQLLASMLLQQRAA